MPESETISPLASAFHRLAGQSSGWLFALTHGGDWVAATPAAQSLSPEDREVLGRTAQTFASRFPPLEEQNWPWQIPGKTPCLLRLTRMAGEAGPWILGTLLESEPGLPPGLTQRNLFEILPMGVTALDADGFITASNSASEAILGLSRAEQVGRRFTQFGWKILGVDGLPLSVEQLKSFTISDRGTQAPNVQLGLQRPSGDITWLDLAAQQLPSGTVIVTYQDISNWRATVESNLRMESLLKTALDLGRMGYFVVHPGTRDWVRNPGLQAIIGSREEVGARFCEAMEQHLGSRSFAFEFQLPAEGGEPEHWFACRGEPIQLPGNDQPIWVGVLQDITHQRREFALARVRAITQAKGRMAGYLAHEVNNPLAGVKNASLLIRRSLGDAEKQGKFLDLMDQGLSRIQEVIRSLTELNRELGTSEPVLVAEIAEGLKALVAHALETGNLKVSLDLPADLRLPSAEAEVIRQILFNLLMNGIEASPAGSTLTILGNQTGGVLEVIVTDQGPGVPEELRGAIWGLGFSTKRASVVGGLTPGLALSRNLLRELGGDLTLLPQEPGEGASFSIRLPLPPMTVN